MWKVEEDAVSLINKLPRVEDRCFCVNVKSGTKLIAILGILIGLTCVSMIMLRGRKQLGVVEVFLVVFIFLFIVVTVIFVVVSAVLLIAAYKENLSLTSYYLWLSMVYLNVQLVLGVAIPLLLVIDGIHHIGAAVMWIAIVLIVAIGWTHFITVVSSYRMNLL